MHREYYTISPSEFLIENRTEFGDNVRYDLIPSKVCTGCPSCGSLNFIKHGVSNRKVRDLSEYGKRVGLVIKVHRYLCKDCSASWTDTFETVGENAKMTNRMKVSIQERALKETFLHISEDLSVSVSTVKRVFSEHVKALDSQRRLVAPRVLGMDENFLNGAYRAIYVDIEHTRIIDMTEDRKLTTVKKWLEELPHKERIECVTIDMWGSYKDAVLDKLPDVPIVIDKFHVVKHVNEALDSIRKGLRDALPAKDRKFIKNNRWLLLRNSEDLDYSAQKRLNNLLINYPQFAEPHLLKEQFRIIYREESRADAEKLFNNWEQAARKYPAFATVADMIRNWHTEIFNYFDYKYTNAATESLNHLAKEIAARGRGYSFDVLRMKVLYGTKGSKPSKYEYYPSDPDATVQEGIPDNVVAGSGADIAELLVAVKDENF